MALEEFTLAVQGLKARCWHGGEGPALLLLHGSGPGASSTSAWRLVLEPLMQHFHVYAIDLFGFGASDTKTEMPYFDADLWLEQGRAMLDHIGGERIYVVGHSISGLLALRLASQDRRVAKLVTTGSMGTRFRCNPATARCWTLPETREQLRATLAELMYDTSAITEEVLDYRMGVLREGNYGAYFAQMFSGDKQALIDQSALSTEELGAITCPVLMIHGQDDVMFPAAETSCVMAPLIADADLLLLSRCAHLPATEHPRKFMDAVRSFLREDA
jgi:2-hydroxymuconate-semialdehyde hydrolase